MFVDAVLDGFPVNAFAIKCAGERIQNGIIQAGNNVSNSVNKSGEHTSNALYSISIAIVKGIANISDQMIATRLTNEYYLLLEKLIELKKDYPDIEIKVDHSYIQSQTIHLEEKYFILLAYLFTVFDNAYEIFDVDINAGYSIEEWISLVFKRMSAYHTDKHVMTSYQEKIIYYSLVTFNDKEFSTEENGDLEYISREEDYEEAAETIYSYFNPNKSNSKYYRISKGVNLLNNWIQQKNCQFLIQYLKQIYTNSVFSVLNK